MGLSLGFGYWDEGKDWGRLRAYRSNPTCSHKGRFPSVPRQRVDEVTLGSQGLEGFSQAWFSCSLSAVVFLTPAFLSQVRAREESSHLESCLLSSCLYI